MMDPMAEFHGKEVLIVSGTSAIGKAAAIELKRRGAHVTATGWRLKNLAAKRDWRDRITLEGTSIDPYDFDEVKRLVQTSGAPSAKP